MIIASKLADCGACVLIDHHTSKGYQESRKKLGVGLSFFDGSKRHCVLLAYREVVNSTVAYNKEILDEILQEYDLALAVSEGRCAIVSEDAVRSRSSVRLTLGRISARELSR